MEVKIDTKEKFTVITPNNTFLSDNMASELSSFCENIIANGNKNIILNLANVNFVEESLAKHIANLQQSSYDQNNSFVICCINETVEKTFEDEEVMEYLNVTPTESEAWDIIQMEEIERELFDDLDQDAAF